MYGRRTGVDAVQAIVLALKMIGAELYTSEEAKAGKLTWNEGQNLGFPVTESIQDVLPK